MKRLACAAAIMLLLIGCGPSGLVAPPSSVPEPQEGELAPGWDEQPDGEPAKPDQGLLAGELLDLLRLPATAPGTKESCGPLDVALNVQFSDAAAGSRYGRLLVHNTSDKPCVVQGYPGFGARGQWGSKFLLIAEQVDALDYEDQGTEQVEVTLAPGESVMANMRWTGELAGAEAEPISLFVVQLAANQMVIGQPVTPEFINSQGLPAPNSGIDIGMLTKVQVGPFRSVAPDSSTKTD